MDDKLYYQVKNTVEETAKALSKAKEARGNKNDPSQHLQQVQHLLSGLRANVTETIAPGWQMDAVFRLIEGATQRKSTTKIPQPAKDLLVKIEVGDIDWALNSLKTEWIRFTQLYAQKWFEGKVRDARN